jgi:hypothetical protein
MTDNTTDRVLYALYCLSRDTSQIDASALGRAAGLTAVQAAIALVELERAGMVDASRARLTMAGLARAARLETQAGGTPQVDLRQQKPRQSPRAVPVAAQGCRLSLVSTVATPDRECAAAPQPNSRQQVKAKQQLPASGER